MKKLFLAFLFAGCTLFSQSNNVGINTEKPNASAILEVSADPAPNVASTTKKGLLLPRVALTGTNDITTIPNPTKGLLVINTVDGGVFPYEVTANAMYYWIGNSWERLPYTSVIEEAVKPRIFYAEENTNQEFTPAEISGPKNNLVTFNSVILNIKNIVTLNTDSSITINENGIFDFSAFVNYNPKTALIAGTQYSGRAFLNMKIQLSTNNGASYVDIFGSRTAWGPGSSNNLKTAILQSTPVNLSKGNRVRLVIANPFAPDSGNEHGGLGNPVIGVDTSQHIPVSKGIRIQLLDFNIK